MSTYDMAWRFLEEKEPSDYVQELACRMLPDRRRAKVAGVVLMGALSVDKRACAGRA